MDQNNTPPPHSFSSPASATMKTPKSATEILQRRQKFLAKRWKRHEYALYDIFTITFSFIDVRKHFMSLALVNKWFYHQVHECLANIEEIVCVDEKEFLPINYRESRLELFLDKLYRTKISRNYLQFEEEMEEEHDEEFNADHHDENVNIENDAQVQKSESTDESSDGVFKDLLAAYNSVKGMFGIPPPPTSTVALSSNKSTKEQTLLKRAIIAISTYEYWSPFRKYRIEKIYLIGTFSKYSSSLHAIEKQGVEYDSLIFFRCGVLVQSFYILSMDFSAYHRAVYINSSFSGSDAIPIYTSTMDIDQVMDVMKEYEIFSISPSLVQFKTNEIMEYVKFEKSGSASSGNILWKALKKYENLYPYLQQVFGDLGVYYLKSMVSEMISITERNFRTFLEKWNLSVQVKKIRLEFLITNTIYCDKIIENFVREANEIDKALEKKKSLAVEKCKLESWAKWVSDTYKKRASKKKIDIMLQ
ncbi:predicted protein [Naegleria gruberi]|uniref:Predicted protein n=1 Tax=Naegleria gruberi TaxID=5762 RepID=D2VLJ1_NAEGR|nr:uncharacterized protein NAEGRDRAFT_80450 [Naegleria gruberi]EFC42396.1 predicted protein [Naegleria gruberi]|eukprot:XP_002675140.1 predicted protein [Naegleria gruberi strain NEG-M]